MVRTGPIITLAFSDDEPPFDALSMVTRIVDQERFLVGLTEIVLTNASTLPRGRRRGTAMSRGRKVRIEGDRRALSLRERSARSVDRNIRRQRFAQVGNRLAVAHQLVSRNGAV